MPATLNIQSAAGFTTPDGGTQSIGPITIPGTIIPARTFVNLLSGNNTVTVPTSAAGVIIVPPSTNTIVLKYKTTSGDTGVAIPLAAPSMFIFELTASLTSLFINAASNTTGNTQILFF